MTPTEQAEQILQTKFDSLKADILKAANDENAKALKQALDAANQEAQKHIQELKTELDTTKTELSEFQVKAKKAELNTVAGFIKKNNEALTELSKVLSNKGKGKAYLQIDKKDIVDTTAILDSTAAVITRSQTNFASNLVLAQQPGVERLDAFDVFENSGVMLVPITGNGASIPYVDEVVTGDAAPQATEGSNKTQIDAEWVERIAYTKTYAGYMRVSDQMLEDIVLLQTWIFNILRRKLKAAYNDAFFNGTGLSGQMNGLSTLATAFSATGLLLGAAATVGIYEVINAAITQARAQNYNVTRVWMNPIDYYKMLSERSDQGRVNSVVELQVLNGYIGTAKIQLTNYVAAGTLYVAEAEVIKTIYRANMFGMPEIGLNGDDFRQNMKSIRAHVRLDNVIYETDKPGVIYVSDIDAAIAAINSDPV